jgi:death on curing protein
VDPTFLTLDEVIEIHRDMIERYGGSPGIRDQGLLESAVAMAQAGFGEQYLHSTLFEMAAAYLFHIVNNHAFVDGNKRTGAMAAFTFLKLNQINLSAGELKFERLVRETAEGKVGKEKIAEFFQKNSKKRR